MIFRSKDENDLSRFPLSPLQSVRSQKKNANKQESIPGGNPTKRPRVNGTSIPPVKLGETDRANSQVLMQRAARFGLGTQLEQSQNQSNQSFQAMPSTSGLISNTAEHRPELFGTYSWDRNYGSANSGDLTHDYRLELKETSNFGGTWILVEAFKPSFGNLRPTKKSIQGTFQLLTRYSKDDASVRWLQFTKLAECSYDNGNVTQSHVAPQTIEVPFQVTGEAVGILISAFGREKMLLKKDI